MTRPFRYERRQLTIIENPDGTDAWLFRWPDAADHLGAAPSPWDGKYMVLRPFAAGVDVLIAHRLSTSPLATTHQIAVHEDCTLDGVVDELLRSANEYQAHAWVVNQMHEEDVDLDEVVEQLRIIQQVLAEPSLIDRAARADLYDPWVRVARPQWSMLASIFDRALGLDR